MIGLRSIKYIRLSFTVCRILTVHIRLLSPWKVLPLPDDSHSRCGRAVEVKWDKKVRKLHHGVHGL